MVHVSFSALMICNTCPEHAGHPGPSVNVFNDSLDLEVLPDISQLKYVISIGSNISVQNTEPGGFPNPAALPFVCISQLNLALLLEIFGTFCKTESLAALVNEVLSKLWPCFTLCVLESALCT